MPFTQTSDRTVVSAIKHTAWSPNKDLLACLAQDSQVHAYRAFPSFQRIWSLSFESEPCALCWHPDGVRLALGHCNGSVSVIAAEDGHTQMKACTHHVNSCKQRLIFIIAVLVSWSLLARALALANK